MFRIQNVEVRTQNKFQILLMLHPHSIFSLLDSGFRIYKYLWLWFIEDRFLLPEKFIYCILLKKVNLLIFPV